MAQTLNIWCQYCHSVSFIALCLQDYFSVIKHPMDMGAIKHKLENNLYYSSRECIDDFRTIFNNCYTYNKPTDVRSSLLYCVYYVAASASACFIFKYIFLENLKKWFNLATRHVVDICSCGLIFLWEVATATTTDQCVYDYCKTTTGYHNDVSNFRETIWAETTCHA